VNKGKEFFKDKGAGFIMSIIVLVFSLATAVVYWVGYSGSSDFSRPVLISIVVGMAAAVLLAVLKRYNWVPVALGLGNFAALLLFIKSIYFYVSVVLYGINGSAFSPAFMSSTVCLLVALILSIADVFMKQVKE